MRDHLFVYGTLAPGRPNEHVLADVAGTWAPAVVHGWLVEDGWGAARGYPALVLGAEGDEVAGFVLASDDLDAHWDRLDAFEGEGYDRVVTPAVIGGPEGRQVDAQVYVAHGRRPEVTAGTAGTADPADPADPASTVSTATGLVTSVGGADPELDARLDAELTAFNAAATSDVARPAELTVKVEEEGELVAGVSGWTWGEAAGIALTWVREDQRGTGVGTRLLAAFESEARRRGCRHVNVASFSFQAPAFYERQGYVEIFRWESVPDPGRDDVHLRKEL